MKVKKMFGLVVAVILVASLSGGCVQQRLPYVEEPTPETVPLPATKEPVSMPILPGEPPQDVTWISPGKVMVGNFAPGARAEWPITIHNGNDWVSTFIVSYKQPGYVAEGYVEAPPQAESWVIIADAMPVLMPKESREVLIVVAMPKDAISSGPQWEFWISVQDTTQTGMILTELCSRWLVQMSIG